jgi:hypothetical protein
MFHMSSSQVHKAKVPWILNYFPSSCIWILSIRIYEFIFRKFVDVLVLTRRQENRGYIIRQSIQKSVSITSKITLIQRITIISGIPDILPVNASYSFSFLNILLVYNNCTGKFVFFYIWLQCTLIKFIPTIIIPYLLSPYLKWLQCFIFI